MAHGQRNEFQKRRDWSKTGRFGRHRFWETLERSKNLASSGEWEKGKKRLNWPFEKIRNRAKIQTSTKMGDPFQNLPRQSIISG